MALSNFRRCFISAPFGTDTKILRQALERRDIQWRDPTKVRSGQSWLDVLMEEVSSADFVCMVVPDDHESNILFELGVAYATKKPILAFVKSPQTLPSDIRSLTYFLSDPSDSKAVSSALDTFLQHAKPTSELPDQSKRKRRATSPKTLSPEHGISAEKRTAELLQKAGFIISESPQPSDRGADLAVWADELESVIGGPLLVEIKSGALSPNRLREAANQLRRHVVKTHGRFGLLIYWDRNHREFPQTDFAWPFIFFLSGEALTNLVNSSQLSKELVRLRNAAVHGKV